MEQENSITPNNKSTKVKPNLFKSLLPIFKNILKLAHLGVEAKVGAIWPNLTKKFKIAFFVVLGFFLLLLIYPLFSKKSNPLNILQTSPKSKIEQIGKGWEKLQIPQRESPFFSLKPKTQSKFGILPQEIFSLTSKEPVDEEFITKNLKSNIPVKVTSISSTEFKIIPEESLKNDQLVTLSLSVKNEKSKGHTFDRNYGWTFQTQGKFRVKTSIPGDKKTDVPLNTGIEITFSQDDYQDPAKLISIEPTFQWRTERHSETVAIVPLNPLNPKTLYTITLKKGLNLDSRNDTLDQDFVFSFQTQELTDSEKNLHPPRLSLNKDFIQTSTSEPPAVTVYDSNWKNDLSLKTQVYKFADSQQFIESRKRIDEISSSWLKYFAENEVVSTGNLPKVSEMELKVQSKDKLDYLQFPESLPEGFYLAQFWYEDGKKLEQLWIQSTNLSAYTSIGRKQTLVWANNVASGEPVADALVTPPNSNTSYATNINGIAVFQTPQIFFDNSTHYIKISSNRKDLILPVDYINEYSQDQQRNPNDYWSYLYHERILYKPGDTVYFWGALKERDSGQVPANVEVSISAGYYYYYSQEVASLATVKVTPDSDGSFIGNIPLTNIPQGYYSLCLKVEGLQITQSGFQVTEYQKPEMKIEVSANKKAVFTQEQVEFSAKATFFDGTFAKQVPLRVHEDTGAKTSEMTTDNKGEIKYLYKPEYRGGDYYPHYESITLNPTLAQNAKIEGYASVYVYGSKLMITSESHQKNGQATLKAVVNQVNLDNVNQGKSFEVKGAIVPNRDVNLSITKTWWEKIEIGTYYDFIEKTTRPSYDYQRHDENILDTKLKTNQNGEISYEFNLEKGKSYKATLSLEDEDKHPATASEYYYYYTQGDYGESSTLQLILDSEKNGFSIGDDVNLNIKLNGENYSDNDQNRFLFILSQRGKQDFFVQDGPKFSFTFEKKHIPNTYASAVIFTGKAYQTAPDYGYYYSDNYFSSFGIYYQKEDSSLELSVASDKEKYSPGDLAKISVTVKKSNQPVADTQINLVLVDEALEAIGGVHKPDILEKLYASVPSEIYYNYYSHKPALPKSGGGGAEMGGGGGNREIFKDTPFFGQAKTNGDGLANFEFTLPDNITTWIIYAQGITKDLDVGQTKGELIASKDFFVTSNFPSEFLQKDLGFITGNGFGNNVSPDQTISYEVTFLQGEKELQKLSGEGKSLKDTSFEFPKLASGDYKVWLKGTLAGQVDGVTYPFKVIESRLDLQMDKKYKLEKGQSLNSLELPGLNQDKPVKLLISDIGQGQNYYQLYSYCFISSNRLEKNLAKKQAFSIIQERFGEEACDVAREKLAAFQNFDGGLAQVSWGGSVLETTAWAIFVDPKAFDQDKLITYLEKSLDENDKNASKIYALWGLSLLGQPHRNELLALSENSVGYKEKALSALALASIGETEISREIYLDLLAEYSYTNQPYVRIQAGTNDKQQTSVDKYVSDTGLALLLGSLVEKNYNEGQYLYLRDYQNQVEDLVLDLGKISFIGQELEKLPNENTQVVFKSPAREEIVDLSKGGIKRISLLKGEAENTKVSVNLGKTEIAAYYFATPDVLSQVKTDSRLTLKREIKKVKGNTGSFKPGDLIQVKIDFDLDDKDAPLGGYTITDHLASGLTFLDNPEMYGLSRQGWPFQKITNVIKYTFYNSPWWQEYGDKSFTYYARASAVGTYLAEPSLLQSHLDLSVIQNTPEESIKIERSD